MSTPAVSCRTKVHAPKLQSSCSDSRLASEDDRRWLGGGLQLEGVSRGPASCYAGSQVQVHPVMDITCSPPPPHFSLVQPGRISV